MFHSYVDSVRRHTYSYQFASELIKYDGLESYLVEGYMPFTGEIRLSKSDFIQVKQVYLLYRTDKFFYRFKKILTLDTSRTRTWLWSYLIMSSGQIYTYCIFYFRGLVNKRIGFVQLLGSE